MTMELNLASANNFQVIFPKLPNETGVDRKLVLYAYGSILPGVSFDETVLNWQGGEIKSVNSNLKYEPWNISFAVDSKFDNGKRLYRGMAHINNNKDVGGREGKHSAVNTTLQVFDNYEKTILKLTFNKMLPISLGEVALSFREGEPNINSELRLTYDYFTLE